MKTPHSSCWPGKRVRIRFKDGAVLITRFREKKGGKIVTDAGKFHMAEVRAFSIYKPKRA